MRRGGVELLRAGEGEAVGSGRYEFSGRKCESGARTSADSGGG
jgi:hypothetical protein